MKLGLGTAQFGLDYGVTNLRGQVPLTEVKAILSKAAASGVDVLDTAAAYGDSEALLGRLAGEAKAFRLVTKLPSLSQLEDEGLRRESWRRAFEQSLERLRVDRVDVLLAHDAADLLGRDGDRLWRLMEDFREAGAAGKVGASLYSGAEIDTLLERCELGAVQLPINALDQRLVRGGHLSKLASRGIEVHARSAFLQGLLLSAPERLPGGFAGLAKPLADWIGLLSARGLSQLQGALLAVRQRPEIACLVVGVAGPEQLEEILSAWHSIEAEAAIDLDALKVADSRLLDPQNWPPAPAEVG